MDLQDNNDIYMTMNIAILSEDVNLNGAQFTQDFIDGVIENKENHVGLPFLVNKDKLESGEYDDLSHELDSATGTLQTDQIGSFVDFWKEEIEGANCLMGSIRIFKRFAETCSAIVELVEAGALETSCEVMIRDYLEVTKTGVRKIHYNDGKNSFFGSAIVTQGAEPRAKPTLLIAEAYEKDINISQQQGVDSITKSKKVEQQDKIETFNNGIDIKYHGTFELSGLKIHELEQKIFNLVNPVDTENGGRDYNFWIRELYTDSVVFEDDRNWNVLYKAKYEVNNTTLTLADQDDWIKGSYGFIPEGVVLSELMGEQETKLEELEAELSLLKEENKTMSKEKKTETELNEEKIEALEKEIANLKETIVAEQGAKVELEGTVKELSTTIDELKPFKEQVEKAEQEAKVKELNDKYSKLISEDVFASEEVQKAIGENDVATLNNIVVSEVTKQKAAEIETASTDKEVTIAAAKGKDLVEKTILQKYNVGL